MTATAYIKMNACRVLTWMSKLTYLPMFLSCKTMIGMRMPSVSSGSRGHVMNVELHKHLSAKQSQSTLSRYVPHQGWQGSHTVTKYSNTDRCCWHCFTDKLSCMPRYWYAIKLKRPAKIRTLAYFERFVVPYQIPRMNLRSADTICMIQRLNVKLSQ